MFRRSWRDGFVVAATVTRTEQPRRRMCELINFVWAAVGPS